MPINRDYRDLFKIFLEEKVDYLVVGAYAVTFYTEPRYTKDIDVLVRPSPDNARRVWEALARFGAPLENVTLDDFTDPDLVYQIGIEPNRIDIIMEISGVDFETAWKNRVKSTYGTIPLCIIGRQELINAKAASGRPQDLLDLENLRSLL